MSDTILTHAPVMCFIASAKPEEARNFYRDMLGLELLMGNEYSLVFSVNDTLTLRVQRVSELKPQQFAVFGWQIASIDGTVTSLSERGVEFKSYGLPSQDARGLCTFENGDKIAWFKDPDGNTLSVAEIAAA